MADLFDRLTALGESNEYPFHMPGHKRNMKEHPLKEMFQIDITEIEGFDNLHHATGILRKMQDDAAKIYQVRNTFFLVNGSTGGILAAISASVQRKKKLLMARNCHKAVYNACLLRGIDAIYVYPKETNHPCIYGDILADDIEYYFKEHEDIGAVILTSPNYDGVVSDITGIAQVVHEHGALLIVDEAHGAHFNYSDDFPESATKCGADIVIQSLHKTLPSLTQTALLHVCSERVDIEKLKEYLAMYQTSSPSYVFMATMQQCIEQTNFHKEKIFKELSDRIDQFIEDTKDLKKLKVLSYEWAKENELFDFDKGKILISTLNCGLNGEQLCEILNEQYHLQMEMASVGYVLGIASVCDTKSGFDRLRGALKEIDAQLVNRKGAGEVSNKALQLFSNVISKKISHPKVMTVYDAYEACKKEVLVEQSAGEVSGEFVYLYPPGVPMIVPGEVITNEFIEVFMQCKAMGLPLQGLRDYKLNYIQTIKKTHT